MPGTAGRSGGDRKSSGADGFPVSLPSMPPGMQKEEQAIWHALLDQIPTELLRGIDTYQLQVLCRCVIDARKLHKDWTNSQDLKSLRMCRQTEQHISRLSAQFGLSPSDRKRLQFEGTGELDDAEEWMNE